jgi:hypothetical protein
MDPPEALPSIDSTGSSSLFKLTILIKTSF